MFKVLRKLGTWNDMPAPGRRFSSTQSHTKYIGKSKGVCEKERKTEGRRERRRQRKGVG
jgi:hypothetical protein